MSGSHEDVRLLQSGMITKKLMENEAMDDERENAISAEVSTALKETQDERGSSERVNMKGKDHTTPTER